NLSLDGVSIVASNTKGYGIAITSQGLEGSLGLTLPAGTVSLTDVTVTGSVAKNVLSFQYYTDVSNISLSGVNIAACAAGWGQDLTYFGTGTLDAGNTALKTIGVWYTGGMDATGVVFHDAAAPATVLSRAILADGFKIANQVNDALDVETLGFARVAENAIWTTVLSWNPPRADIGFPGTTVAGSLNRAIAASRDLDTIYVQNDVPVVALPLITKDIDFSGAFSIDAASFDAADKLASFTTRIGDSAIDADVDTMTAGQIAAIAAEVTADRILAADIANAAYALNQATADNFDDAFTVSGITPDAAYTALDLGRQLAVRNDMVSNRDSVLSGFDTVGEADTLFGLLVEFRGSLQAFITAINAASSASPISASEFNSLNAAIIADMQALVGFNAGTLVNGAAVDVAGAQAALAYFNALNAGGQASYLAAISGQGYTSFTQYAIAAAALEGATDLANLNGAGTVAEMETAIFLAQFTSADYVALESARKTLVATDMLRKRTSPYASLEAAEGEFTKSVAVYSAVQSLVASANAATFSADDLNALYAALDANGGVASGEPGTDGLLLGDVEFQIALFSTLSVDGAAALNAGYASYVSSNGAMGSLSQVIAVGSVLYGIDTADVAAFQLLEAPRQDLVFANTGFGTNDSPATAGARFNASVVAYTAVKTIVDNTNAGTATVEMWSDLSAAIGYFGDSIVGAPNTAGLQKRDVDFTVQLLSSLNATGLASLNAINAAVDPDYGSLGQVMDAGLVIFYGSAQAAETALTDYGTLVAERQALVFVDLGVDNSSPSQAGDRFAALASARLAIQVAVDAANANTIVAADFSAGGKMVAVRDGIAAVEALGLYLNGDPAATTAAADAAIAGFLVLNDGGRAVILDAINITGTEAPHGSFTALATAANAAYPTAVLANLNAADATNIVSAL
ncbi:MAG: hypothetical protein ACO31E_11810, partial [Phycisphaerales bacterium]